MPNISKEQIAGKISRATLGAVIGSNLARSAIGKMQKGVLIPNFEHIHRGDIILTRHCAHNKDIKNSPVSIAQQSLESKSYCQEACTWGHAMVYVGNMFIAESQPFFFKGIIPKSGLRAIPITAHSTTRQLLICRHKGINGREEDVANYAALNCLADNRRYPFKRTIKSAILDKPSKKKLHFAANCSEFALECLAIGAECMVDTYASLNDGIEEFYPADFFHREDFEKIPMQYLTLDG